MKTAVAAATSVRPTGQLGNTCVMARAITLNNNTAIATMSTSIICAKVRGDSGMGYQEAASVEAGSSSICVLSAIRITGMVAAERVSSPGSSLDFCGNENGS